MLKINVQLFAHKKGMGSTRNGRDSESKRLGVKRADGPTDRKKTGSLFRWKPDNEVFTEIDIPADYFRDVLKRQAVVNKGIKIRFRNQVGAKFEEEEYLYQNGITEHMENLVGDNAFTMPVFWETERRGRDSEKSPEMKLKITAALCFSKQIGHLEYYHNSSWLEYGGSPDRAVRSGFVAAFDKYLRDSGKYSKNESKIIFQDIQRTALSLCRLKVLMLLLNLPMLRFSVRMFRVGLLPTRVH